MKLYYSRENAADPGHSLFAASFAYDFAKPFQTGLNPIPGGCMVVGGCISRSAFSQLAAECRRREITAVCTGFVPAPDPDVTALCSFLHTEGICCILAAPCWRVSLPALPLITAALSGGRWKTYIADQTNRCISPALDFQRMHHRFPLPCKDGQGIPIGESELAGLLSSRSSSFYSQSLMCQAQPCIAEQQCSFLLWDTVETLCRKVEYAASIGVEIGFLLDGEWSPQEASAAAERARENPTIQR